MAYEEENLRPSVMARRAVSEVIALQRRIFERQRKLIESREAHQTRGFARYRNEYRRATSGYIAESGWGALCDAVAEARLAYVADYHTLRLAQKTFVKLIRAVMQQVDNLCLAVEFVHERHQHELDRFLMGEILESTFLRRIHYKEQWPYDIWPNFKPIFDLASEHGLPMIAIDTDSDLPLPERDRRAAVRIARAVVDHPSATILVYTGQ
ncbi:MAG: ChaN family lipoprotein, partial [Deltaproteobacteria bacterium]|nr:ChaN family lipoprotein [Deltaproteobacteria bacterium]